jgi:hypothetical protein
LSNWFLFLSSFVFPLLFRYCFIPVSLSHVVSSLVYPNLLGTKMLGCCCCCTVQRVVYAFFWYMNIALLVKLKIVNVDKLWPLAF